MVGNVTVAKESEANERYYRALPKGGIHSLKKVSTGAWTQSIYELRRMKEVYDFKEFRIRCFKPWVGKQVNVYNLLTFEVSHFKLVIKSL